MSNRPIIGEFIKSPYRHGVFYSVDDIFIECPNVWDAKEWLETAKLQTRAILEQTKRGDFVVEEHLSDLVELLANLPTGQEVVIYDIGGGLGDNYVQLQRALGSELFKTIDYQIVETEQNCIDGEKFTKKFGSPPKFLKLDSLKIDDSGNKYTLVLLCGVLSYIPGWQNAIQDLCERGIKTFYITRTVFSNRVKSFFTVQFIVPSTGPYAGKYIGDCACEVINFQELKDIFKSKNFSLSKEHFLCCYREAMGNLPEPYRCTYYSSLVFEKEPS
ncbi:hypothetical protein tpqmel_0484 [Candidatus Gastranaerophilus sp. (ex Termes propinquus)]|nr:hypothetical protein tpqmel_0484 [Candidatus Gastranaerophilus sp. (ex Termes propinquus)]